MADDSMIPGNEASGSDVVNEQALYSSVMYLPLNELPLGVSPTLTDILTEAEKYVNNPSIPQDKKEGVQDYVNIINEMCAKQGITPSNVTMGNPSWANGNAPFGDPKAFMGCTFTNAAGEETIAFRGTPNKSWLDNGYSLASPDGYGGDKSGYYYPGPDGTIWGPMSKLDKATLQYAAQLMKEGKTFDTTGHSKGGHEAMLVAMVFGDNIKQCYAFDGYGVSPEFYNRMAYNLGEDFDKMREKIMAINGNNDFVNGLGVPLSLNKNRIYLLTNLAGGFTYLHDIRGIIANGRLAGIDANGQGAVAGLFSFVDTILELDPNTRNKLVLGCMYLAQKALGKGEDALGDAEGNNKEAMVSAGVVLIIAEVILVTAGSSFISWLSKGAPWQIAAMQAILLVISAFVGAYRIYDWLRNFFDGGRHAAIACVGANSLIRVETNRLDEYATQLSALNGTVEQYVWRAQALAVRGADVGLNVPNGYSELLGLAEMIRTSVAYLNGIKESLEKVEKKVRSAVPTT